jgi:DNA polymerase III delta prime subunit
MTPSTFIGKTGLIGQVLHTKVPLIKRGELADPLERRLLFTGPPGVGKTELAKLLALELAGEPINVEFRMGSQVNVEVVRDWLRNAPYRPLLGDMTVRLIDELDTVPTLAVTELRQYLDALPRSVAVLATTNKTVKELVEPLQTRFAVWKFDGVQTSVVAEFLVRRFPELPAATLSEIARKTNGNVRAALLDATSERDVARFRQLAA